MNKPNIAVLAGGYSGEYDISIQSATEILEHIDTSRFSPIMVILESEESWWAVHSEGRRSSIDKSNFTWLDSSGDTQSFEVAFIMVHGTPGEDGLLQKYFENLNIPFTTGSSDSVSTTFNKYLTNNKLRKEGLLVAKSYLIEKGNLLGQDELNNILKLIPLPCFIKPNHGGSSLGISKVLTKEDILPSIYNAFKTGTPSVLIESLLIGKELSVGVVPGDDNSPIAMPITEIISENEFYDCRELSRFESINVDLSQRQYGKALYSIYTLKKTYQNNKFLDISLTKSWYGLIVYKNRGRYDEVTERTSLVQGESYPLHVFLNALNGQQVNAIGLRYIYDNSVKYKKDELLAEYFEKCKAEMVNHSAVVLEDFKNYRFIDTLKQKPIIESTSTYKSTFKFDFEKKKEDNKFKLEKIKKDNQFKLKKPEPFPSRNIKFNTSKAISNEPILIPSENDFYLNIFYDLVLENEFNKLFKEIKFSPTNYKSALLVEDRGKVIESTGKWFNININKLLIVNPNYQDFGMTNSKKLIKSERKQVKISKYYEEEYANLQLERKLLDIRSLDSTQVDKFNHISIINSWATELAEHEDIDMISSSHDKMKM